jgi:hypothetical protein
MSEYLFLELNFINFKNVGVSRKTKILLTSSIVVFGLLFNVLTSSSGRDWLGINDTLFIVLIMVIFMFFPIGIYWYSRMPLKGMVVLTESELVIKSRQNKVLVPVKEICNFNYDVVPYKDELNDLGYISFQYKEIKYEFYFQSLFKKEKEVLVKLIEIWGFDVNVF